MTLVVIVITVQPPKVHDCCLQARHCQATFKSDSIDIHSMIQPFCL